MAKINSKLSQATQKKAILYGKKYYLNPNHHGIIMMSQANAPIHRYKTSLIYYPVFFNMSNLNLNFYLRVGILI